MEEFSTAPQGAVDPEVRAFVTSLVTAIGGTGSFEDGRYVLGDDALACLRDLKRWLRLYDEKLGRLDVARVLAERNLVKGDLLEILATWPEDATEDRIKSKIALACFELLVPLTWPLEKNEEQATANHYRNVPYLQLAQISYKREILEHPSTGMLRAAVRAMLPSLALPSGERTQRDEGIIKLILYFLRNIAMISAPDNLPVEWNEKEVSRSATIEAFQKQDIFPVLSTISSNIEDFANQDVVILEILFHLLKGIDVNKLFLDEVQLEAKHTHELKDDLQREASMLRSYAKTAPTRHNRFGTMIWVKRDEGRGVSCVSGQDVLSDPQVALRKMDQSKKYNKPKRRTKEEKSSNNFGMPTPLSNSATQHLRAFVEEFLDSGFNPLMYHLRRAIEREADRILEVHSHQFFYLISWCLEAERARRKCQKDTATQKGQTIETDSYGLVASVLNQETFILLNRYMEDRFDHKLWLDLNAGMRSFIQILLTVQDMAESSLDEDQEIADNIQNRIFYEETTHDRVVAILKGYKDQGFSYLDACTELAHVFLRLLERYSKQNLDLQVRSRRRYRKKAKKTSAQTDGENGGTAENASGGGDSETEELAEAQRVSRERKFDFGRYAAKFVCQNSVDTFAKLLTYYNDLSVDQLKRVHRYFYRVAFKQDMSVMLFRLDILYLLNEMVKGSMRLDKLNPMFIEWEEFSKQLFRRFFKKLEERPALAVEVLFSKIQKTAYYLEYGYEKQTVTGRPRAPAELEIKGNYSREEQIGIVIGVLHDDNMELVEFVKKALDAAAEERKSWEAVEEARKAERAEAQEGQEPPAVLEGPIAPAIPLHPSSEDLRLALFKNNKLRLLLSLCGFERLGDADDPDAPWHIPSSILSTELQATATLIFTHQTEPKLNYATDPNEEAIPPEQLLRRKSAGTKTARRSGGVDWGEEGDEGDDDLGGFLAGDDDDEEHLFPAGGPTPRAPNALAELKAARRKRKRATNDDSDGDPELDDALRQARRKARLEADLAKRRKIKSAEFVRFSDDEDDEEEDERFFAAEEQRRQEHARKVHRELEARRLEGKRKEQEKRKKKGKTGDQDASKDTADDLDSDSASDSDVEGEVLSRDETHRRDGVRRGSDARVNGDSDDTDTPPSSQSGGSETTARRRKEVRTEMDTETDAEDVTVATPAIASSAVKEVRMTDAAAVERSDEDEEGDGGVTARPSARRARMVLLDDSDDE